jgi:hypothetical protein
MKSPTFRKLATLLGAFFVSSVILAGCSHVRPWQREQMARIEKQLDGDAAGKAYEAKMWSVREGAAGGMGKAGGGCGCN